MRLRQRLLAVLVGSALVTGTVLLLASRLLGQRSAEVALRVALESRLDAVGRERCEREEPGPGGGPPKGPGPGPPRGRPGGPGGPGGVRRPVQVFFYTRNFTPRGGPPFPPGAEEPMRRGATFVVVPSRDGGVFGAMATGWDSEQCAYASAHQPNPVPFPGGPILGVVAGLFLAVVAGSLYGAAASPVRRIRALADGVRQTAASGYVTPIPVEGRDEIADLGRAFAEAAGSVRAQIRAVEQREAVLRDFVAHTTHDVGVPLTVLAGHLAQMREHLAAGKPLDAAVLAGATQEAQYIASLLHNLGAVSRLETEEVLAERHPVDLNALVERVVVRHAGLARDAGLELNHAVPEVRVVVPGDVTLLEQALNNLVHNAIRHHRPAGGHVAVVLDVQGAGFTLTVTDDGPGVTGEELPRLGEARFRGGDARSRRPGLGVGLSIVRAVATRHGFALTFRPAEGGGLAASLSGARA